MAIILAGGSEGERSTYDVSQSGWPDSFGEMLLRHAKTADCGRRPIRVLSLFSGAGGLDIGFRDAGFEILESVEIEERFCATLRANTGEGCYFASSNVRCIDIRDYEPHVGPVDFIIGGPPCQTFSAAGRRANGVLGTTDARGVLFREYVRILGELRPQGFLFENVYGIVGAQNGEPWKEILEAFSEAGYRLFHRVLDAADYGAPQHRERLIIVGLREGIYRFPRPLFGPDSAEGTPFYTASQAIATAPNAPEDIPGKINGRYGHLIPAIPPGLNYSFYTEQMGNPVALFAWRSKFSDFMYKADPEEPVRTIKAQGGQYTGPYHWENRHFSVPEYKRLQTFPDVYEIEGGRGTQIHQIGNSVPPQFARVLAVSVRDQIFGRPIPIELEGMGDDFALGFRRRKRMLTAQYREKARKAFDHMNMGPAAFSEHSYRTELASGFSLVEVDEGTYKVSVSHDSSLRVSVRERGTSEARAGGTSSCAYRLTIAPVKDWRVAAVTLEGEAFGSSERVLTVLWKAVERELACAGIKADMVQLAGYYQYKSAIRCSLDSSGDDGFGRVLGLVTRGSVTRKMMSAEELSTALDLDSASLLSVAKRLRSLGYEVRNWNTNSQIPEGSWLIPYEFPTLTPQSIQLGKEV